jgi:DnaK suppressor protein
LKCKSTGFSIDCCCAAKGVGLIFHTARRQDVTTPKKKVAAPVKTTSAKAAPAKKGVQAKPAAPVKSVAKAKTPAKTVSKLVTQTVVKAPAKTAAKAVTKAPVKASTKASPKPVVKAKAAPAPLKTAKSPKSGVVAAKSTPVKTKAATPVAPKAPVTASKPTSAPKAKVAPAKSSPQAIPVPKAKSMTVQKVATTTPEVAPVVEAVASVAAPAAPEQLVRATRPSARLAQITVPSLPPAVASTAAKSSFMPTTPVVAVSAPFAPIKKDPKLANNWKTKPVEDLTDAEILAMSDDEYMNSVQMAYFRRKLSILKQEILYSAGATTEHLREDTVVVPDPADRATIEEEHALELRTRDRERKLLKKIEQSIVLIDGGEYGYCDETGEPIGVGRLLARPTATLSLEAQQRRELKQKMFGD